MPHVHFILKLRIIYFMIWIKYKNIAVQHKMSSWQTASTWPIPVLQAVKQVTE